MIISDESKLSSWMLNSSTIIKIHVHISCILIKYFSKCIINTIKKRESKQSSNEVVCYVSLRITLVVQEITVWCRRIFRVGRRRHWARSASSRTPRACGDRLQESRTSRVPHPRAFAGCGSRDTFWAVGSSSTGMFPGSWSYRSRVPAGSRSRKTGGPTHTPGGLGLDSNCPDTKKSSRKENNDYCPDTKTSNKKENNDYCPNTKKSKRKKKTIIALTPRNLKERKTTIIALTPRNLTERKNYLVYCPNTKQSSRRKQQLLPRHWEI